MSSSYIINSAYRKPKDINDKNLDFVKSNKIVDIVEQEKNRKKNRNEQKIEPIYTDSFINNRKPAKHPGRSAMIGYKKLSFSSIVD